MDYVFNPIHNKSPQGAVLRGTDVTYTVQVSRFAACTALYFILIDDRTNTAKKIKMPLIARDAEFFTYEATISFQNAGLYWYHFEVQNQGGSFYLCKTPLFDVEGTPMVTTSFAQFVFEKKSTVDKNYNSGIVYHVFVDRFKKSGTVTAKNGVTLRRDWGGEITKNSTDFLVINRECFGGNLQGVIDKLPYINKLGVKTIFLSPIFESYSYHKYDTADYERVDSMFGGEAALDALIAAAGKYGIKILLDGVFNHVGSDSIYFNKEGRFDSVGAYQSQKSKFYNWFSFYKFPDNYSAWWGIDTLPQFNENNAALQKFIAGPTGVVAKYMDKGILGFRLDVADEIDDPLLNLICARIKKSKNNALVMGEVWEDAATKIAYDKRRAYFSGNQLDSVMNYPLRNAIIEFVLHGNTDALVSTMNMIKDHYPVSVQHNLMNFLGTHDTKRIITVLEESFGNNKAAASEKAFQLLKIASAIQYCAPGVPAVFYGDEVGIHGGDAPFCRVCYPWGGGDKETLAWYQKLGALRADPVFVDGDFNIILAHNGVFILERTNGKKRVIVAANCGQDDFKLNLKNPMKDVESAKIVKNSVLLAYNEFVILTS